jgi:hypothetical protein
MHKNRLSSLFSISLPQNRVSSDEGQEIWEKKKIDVTLSTSKDSG